jgi:tRNA(fMet)-specific endonuclease VapC
MAWLLDTNIVSDLIRNPSGAVVQRIARVGEDEISTSIIVAAELRYGAAKRGSPRLTQRVEQVLGAIRVHAIEQPTDEIYARVRCELEESGEPIGGNDLIIAAQALALDCTLVTDNEREFARVRGLACENWLRG